MGNDLLQNCLCSSGGRQMRSWLYWPTWNELVSSSSEVLLEKRCVSMRQIFFPGGKGRFAPSLSVQVSLLLVLAALLPLIITIASSELLSRPQLIAKANSSMETD